MRVGFIALMFISCTVLVLGLGCGRQHPRILNFEREPVPASVDGTAYTLKEVEQAILTACRNKGWSAAVVTSGEIEASITIRSRHRAKIAIMYSTSQYSIQYVDSSGLGYENGSIHPNYNHWIARLDAEIKKELGLRTQRF